MVAYHNNLINLCQDNTGCRPSILRERDVRGKTDGDSDHDYPNQVVDCELLTVNRIFLNFQDGPPKAQRNLSFYQTPQRDEIHSVITAVSAHQELPIYSPSRQRSLQILH